MCLFVNKKQNNLQFFDQSWFEGIKQIAILGYDLYFERGFPRICSLLNFTIIGNNEPANKNPRQSI